MIRHILGVILLSLVGYFPRELYFIKDRIALRKVFNHIQIFWPIIKSVNYINQHKIINMKKIFKY